MRILFADQFSEPGGAQLCLRDVIEESRSRGWHTRLVVPGSGLPASLASYKNGSKAIRDLFAFGADTIQAAAAMRSTVRRDCVDLIYANGPRVLAAAALTGAPLVFHAHSYLAASHARAIVKLALRFRRAAVFANSQFVAEPLRSMGHAAEVRVIYNGVADQTFVARSFASSALAVGIVGRISPEKGHLDFVSAARQCSRAMAMRRKFGARRRD